MQPFNNQKQIIFDFRFLSDFLISSDKWKSARRVPESGDRPTD